MRGATLTHRIIVTMVGWPKRFLTVNNKWINLTLWVDKNRFIRKSNWPSLDSNWPDNWSR